MDTNASSRKKPYSLNLLFSYLRKAFIEEKMNNLVGYTTLGILCFLVVFIISKVGVLAGSIL